MRPYSTCSMFIRCVTEIFEDSDLFLEEEDIAYHVLILSLLNRVGYAYLFSPNSLLVPLLDTIEL